MIISRSRFTSFKTTYVDYLFQGQRMTGAVQVRPASLSGQFSLMLHTYRNLTLIWLTEGRNRDERARFMSCSESRDNACSMFDQILNG